MEYLKKIFVKFQIVVMFFIINGLYYFICCLHPHWEGTLEGLLVFHLIGTAIIIFSEKDGTDLMEYGIVLGFFFKKNKPLRFVWVWYISLAHLIWLLDWTTVDPLSFLGVELFFLALAIVPWKAFLEILLLLLQWLIWLPLRRFIKKCFYKNNIGSLYIYNIGFFLNAK